MTKMTTSPTEPLLKLIRSTYSKLLASMMKASPAVARDEDLEFYQDDKAVMYWATTASKSVMSSDKETLMLEGNPVQNWLVNPEIISTYLTDNDLGLIVSISGDMESALIGAFDRSTQTGLYYAPDWFNKERLDEEVALANEGVGFPMEYVETILPGVDTTTPQFKRSIVRMRNLLADCRSHQLTTACGFEVRLTDA